jgi:hypothetical protein
MTFSKWRSYSYKPLESRHKRKNTIAAVRSSQQALPSLSDSLSHDTTTDDVTQSPAPAENGTATTSNVHTSPPDVFATDGSSSSGRRRVAQRRPRSFSVPAWTTSLRSRLSLRRRPSGARQLRSSLSPSPGPEEEASPEAVGEEEESDQELDAVLREAWGSVLAAGEVVGYSGLLRRKQALEYSRKMTGLRRGYELRLAEIRQREATFAREFLCHDESTPLLLADQLTIPVALQRAIRDTQSSGKFDRLRQELKKETVASVLALRARHPALQARLRQREEKARRPRSCPWPSTSLVYCNPHSEAVQSGSMVGVFDGFYATENYSEDCT